MDRKRCLRHALMLYCPYVYQHLLLLCYVLLCLLLWARNGGRGGLPKSIHPPSPTTTSVHLPTMPPHSIRSYYYVAGRGQEGLDWLVSGGVEEWLVCWVWSGTGRHRHSWRAVRQHTHSELGGMEEGIGGRAKTMAATPPSPHPAPVGDICPARRCYRQ